jgi:small-conductance mechanosensitive channel
VVSKDALDNGVSDVAVMAAVTGQLKDRGNQLLSLRTQFAKFEEVLEHFANNNETQISLLQSRLVKSEQSLGQVSAPKAKELPSQLEEVSISKLEVLPSQPEQVSVSNAECSAKSGQRA